MDMESELLKQQSRTNAERIARLAAANPRRMRALMDCFLTGDLTVAQRAAWSAGIVAEEHPAMVRPYLARMVARIQEPGIHDAVKRCVVRLLQSADIPRSLLGTVATLCFQYLGSPEEPIAVRCYAMTVLERIAAREPELQRELRLVLEHLPPSGSGGIRSRARHTLARLGRSGESRPTRVI